MVIFSIVYDVMILEWDGSGVEEEYSAAMGLFGIPECLSLNGPKADKKDVHI